MASIAVRNGGSQSGTTLELSRMCPGSRATCRPRPVRPATRPARPCPVPSATTRPALVIRGRKSSNALTPADAAHESGLESRSQGTNREMLEPAILIGLGAVAVWTYVNYPRLRPGSLLRAIVHVAVSLAGFTLLPALLGVLVPLLPSRTSQPYVVLALLIPVLTYVLLSWVWLIARILQDMLRGPRGGHPVSTES